VTGRRERRPSARARSDRRSGASLKRQKLCSVTIGLVCGAMGGELVAAVLPARISTLGARGVAAPLREQTGRAAATRAVKTGRPLPAVVTASAAASPIVATNESTVEPACRITTRPWAEYPSAIRRRAESSNGVRDDAAKTSPLVNLGCPSRHPQKISTLHAPKLWLRTLIEAACAVADVPRTSPIARNTAR
jgi:hypothetical protein